MKTHYSTCDPATESDNHDYWSEYTACGLHETEAPLTDKKNEVTCKRCLKRLELDEKIQEKEESRQQEMKNWSPYW